MKISIEQPQSIYELGARDNQEDWIYPELGQATLDSHLFIVCDGMGGYEKGEVASKLVGETISSYITEHHEEDTVFDDKILREAINLALDKLDEIDAAEESTRMGTTLALVYFHKGGCTMAHIGDSRIYHIRPSEHRIIYKSRDHSLVYDLLQAEEITLEEMKTYPKKNVITRALMPNMDERPTASITHTTDIQPGDCFYLCSDGMLEEMDDNTIVDILCAAHSNDEKNIFLINSTSNNSDNHSAHLLYVNAKEAEDDDHSYLNDETISRSNAIILEEKYKDNDADNHQLDNLLEDKKTIETLPISRLVKDAIVFLIGFVCALILLKCQ